MSQEANTVEQTARGRRETQDPLASRTLAKIYASQGHKEVAEGIYAQIRRQQSAARSAASSRDHSEESLPALRALEKLLALREAARKFKGMGEQATRPNETYGY